MIRGIHHAAIICSNFEQSKSFYTKVLGFEVVHEAYRGERQSFKVDLSLPDGTRLELFSFPETPPRASYPEACGLRHIAFRVDNLTEAISRLSEHGIPFQEIRVDEFTGKRFMFIEDPDGLPIEFYEVSSSAMRTDIPAEDITLSYFVADIGALPAVYQTLRPWEVLGEINEIVRSLGPAICSKSAKDQVYIHPSAVIETSAIIKGPAIISADCFIAAGAYLRGGVYLAEGVRVGPGCEIKSSLVMKDACLAHFNFIGDSIIGSRVNFEAGSHTANHWNERQDKSVSVRTSDGLLLTGSNKMGAIVGDDARIGANSVLSPGTLLKKRAVISRLTLIDQQVG